ncbi:MAG: insecticidal toxin protein [Acidobacteria bacterium]|nr:insecticidal toxin protein [Acidobacteriota bacterium]
MPRIARTQRFLPGTSEPKPIAGDVTFRFYPHSHPFVDRLVARLAGAAGARVGGVANVQEADTGNTELILVRDEQGGLATAGKGIPVRTGDGKYGVLPFGVRVALPADVRLSLNLENVPVRMTEDIARTLPAGTKVTLTGVHLLRLLTFNPELKLAGASTTLGLMAGTTLTLVEWQPRPELHEPVFSWLGYRPSALVRPPYPMRELAFDPVGPASGYAVYNWELFYHIPLAVAIHLSRNERFDEAQKWFQYIFDPTDDSDGLTPERYWKFRPLRTTDTRSIADILVNLSTGTDLALKQRTVECIQRWMANPFRPHLVARFRPSAYMHKAVMAYLDNLVAWGDSLFRQDRPETVDDAADRYVEAAGILGPRPQVVPRKGKVGPATYASLKRDARESGRAFDAFSNVLTEIESDLPFAGVTTEAGSDGASIEQLAGVGREALYFCAPANEKLIGYWDTVADRLFKIRNSLNFAGAYRQLPLFEPPIDPALLAKGVAAGLDVTAVVAGLTQPLPLVRFQYLAQKAAELCQEVKSLGANLLAAMEKEDSEVLAIMRAQHEGTILALSESVKYAQWREAAKSREALRQSFRNAVERYEYYEMLLGAKEGDIQIVDPDELDLSKDRLAKMDFESKEPDLPRRAIEMDISEKAGGTTGGEIETLSSYEVEELEKLADAQRSQDTAAALDTIAAVLRPIPTIATDIKPFGVGAGFSIGGADIAAVLQIAAGISRAVGAHRGYEAGRAAKIGGYARRQQDWALQSNLAAGDINQIYRQYVAAWIREAIAEKEWRNHKKQIEQSKRIEEFLKGERGGKNTNQALYAWMKRELKGVYRQCYEFAFEVAKKAERALQHELGDKSLAFVQPGYLGGKEGLLAGEKLHLDIKRMEMAHSESAHEANLYLNASLLELDPLAVIQLRATGRCTFSVPEELFDLNLPGMYFRRIHSVALGIPCVTGPYTGVNCTLRLIKSQVRKSAVATEGYARNGDEDPRFEDDYELESMVASRGSNDSGRFEPERSTLDGIQRGLFEGKGAVGDWQLELPANPSKGEPRLFDYDTISDVVLHIQYTARDGGVQLKTAAAENVRVAIEEARAAGSVRLFSVRHEFSSEWAAFKNATAEDNGFKLAIKLDEVHYPFWSQGMLDEVKAVRLFASGLHSAVNVFEDKRGGDAIGVLKKNAVLGGIHECELDKLPSTFDGPTGELDLYFKTNAMSELWFAVTWRKV